MPTYGGNKFSHTGDYPKWIKSKTEGKKPNGINNGQATHGARKPPGPKIQLTGWVVVVDQLDNNATRLPYRALL